MDHILEIKNLSILLMKSQKNINTYIPEKKETLILTVELKKLQDLYLGYNNKRF